MKAIMKLDSNVGIRQIVSDLFWIDFAPASQSSVRDIFSFGRVCVLVHLAAALTIKRFLELKIRSGEKQVYGIWGTASQSY